MDRACCRSIPRLIPVLPVLVAVALWPGADRASARAWLGVSVQDVTEELKEAMNLTGTSGALISEVFPDSPAKEAGLEARDLILRFDGETIDDAGDLVDLLSEKDPGDQVSLQFLRGRDERRAMVKLAESPEPETPAPRAPLAPPTPSTFGGPQIGVAVHPLDENLAKRFDTKAGEGVLVLRVEPESPAAKAGIETGDVIQKFDGQMVSDAEDLRRAVRRLGPGDDWEVALLREGRKLTLNGRIERDWGRPPEPGESQVLPPSYGESGGSVLGSRQLRRLEREIEELRARLRRLEREIDRLRER